MNIQKNNNSRFNIMKWLFLSLACNKQKAHYFFIPIKTFHLNTENFKDWTLI